MADPIRLRFAPSPTGYLHVGGARTALVNWCLARRFGGTLILRIEDTDRERSSDEMVKGILDGLTWLGLDWDEGPYHQAEASHRAHALADEALAAGAAYRCYCSPAELEAEKLAAEAAGRPIFQYPGTCRDRSADETAKLDAAGRASCVRFKVPRGTRIEWDDIVHDRSGVDSTEIEDFVLLRQDGSPTYHVAVVADDIHMAITHIVRGDDHLSNTPKQILLYRAVGKEPPQFAHLPLILGPDKKKLSKRTGTTSVTEFATQDYFPEAVFNFLALLGWSPGGDREVMTRAEIVAAFDFARLNKSSAVFDTQKLDWLNQEHLQRHDPTELIRLLRTPLEAMNLWNDRLLGDDREWFAAVVELLKPRARKIRDLASTARPFLTTSFDYDDEAVKKHLKGDDLAGHVRALIPTLAAANPFDAVQTELALRATAEARAVGAGKLIHATRVALTGQAVSPGIFEMLAAMGRDRTIARLTRLVDYLAQSAADRPTVSPGS